MRLPILQTIQALSAKGKGILAADESEKTIGKRFHSVSIEGNQETRREYREILFSTVGISRFFSGIILHEETLGQTTQDGTPFSKRIEEFGMLPGIKVDLGTQAFSDTAKETWTKGLETLSERAQKYVQQGAKFAKWRSTFWIDTDLPSSAAISTNVKSLAEYAALCHDAGLVPIVEPEVLMEGAHGFSRCYDVTKEILLALYAALGERKIVLENTILKPNMVLPGVLSQEKPSTQEVAEKTIQVLVECVPKTVPIIAFLSGGQEDVQATAHLDAMNRMGPHPWILTFSYGRALQQSALRMWAGKKENREKAQRTLAHRAYMNHLAVQGQWTMEAESAPFAPEKQKYGS